MTKLSIASRMFERTLQRIFPKGDDAWLQKFRRRIYYPIVNDWGNYGYYRTDGGELENVKIRMLGYIYWQVGGYVRWAYTATGLAPWICKLFGHKLVDHSSAGPDSGNMDHECDRCGKYWHATLY